MTGKTGSKDGGGKRREPGNNPGDEAAAGTPGTGEAICPVCRGSGRSGDAPCENCGGSGRIIEGIGGA
jgi:DnaJ-class molecular chaperone